MARVVRDGSPLTGRILNVFLHERDAALTLRGRRLYYATLWLIAGVGCCAVALSR